jgi:hypothetical protein
MLGEGELVQVVLRLRGILHLQGIPQEILRLQVHLRHLEILLVVLPLVVVPIQMEFGGGLLLLPAVLGGSAWLGPIARNRATSSSLTCPVCGLIVPAGIGMVSVRLIGSLMFSDSANVCAIS